MQIINVYKTMSFCRMVNLHFQIFETPFPNISSPKTQVSIYSVSVY